MHAARLEGRPPRQRRFAARLGDLPYGTFVTVSEDTGAWLRFRDRLLHWTHRGYDRAIAAEPESSVSVLTPAPVVAAFRAGYVPAVHASAERLQDAIS